MDTTQVAISSNEIRVISSELFELDELFGYLNGLKDEELSEIQEAMPVNYEYILEDEYELFNNGSIQLIDCGWQIQLTYVESTVTLSITNFK